MSQHADETPVLLVDELPATQVVPLNPNFNAAQMNQIV